MSKAFLNNKKYLPFHHYYAVFYKFLKKLWEKAEKFNFFFFFAKQCSLINTNIDLPSVLSKKTHKLLSAIHFTSDDILEIIKNLGLNKAHSLDVISTSIIEICDASISKTPEIIFRSCLKERHFQLNGKKLVWFQQTKKEINKT